MSLKSGHTVILFCFYSILLLLCLPTYVTTRVNRLFCLPIQWVFTTFDKYFNLIILIHT